MDEEALTETITTLRQFGFEMSDSDSEAFQKHGFVRPSVIFHAGGVFRRCKKPMEEMVQPNIAMAEARRHFCSCAWHVPTVLSSWMILNNLEKTWTT